MIGRTLSHYKVLEKLGSGGMGEVYVAEDTKLSRNVALKVLPPEMASPERLMRFEREAKAVAALDHPNIVTIHSVEESDGVHFLTMQLVKGKTLSELISKKGLPLNKLFEIAIPLADAVSAAHEQGIIHRDLKPDNLMVTDDGRLMILDFGLAKLKQEFAEEGLSELPTQSPTQEGRILGTVAYMSPEQAEGKQIDHRSDIFSIGIILYEMATGQRPFRGDTTASMLSSILRDTPTSATEINPGVPRDLGKIIKRCLEKEPRRRYQTAIDVFNELEELKKDVDSGEVFEGAPSRQHSKNKPWLLAAAVVVLALALAATLTYVLRQADEGVLRLTNPVQVTSAVGVENYPTWSPDGRQLAYESNQSGNPDIWVTQVGGGQPVNRTADHIGLDRYPSWSPDGRQIAFLSQRDGTWSLYTMSALGGSPRKVVSVVLDAFATGAPRWSASGAEIAVPIRDSGRKFVEIVSPRTQESRRVALPEHHGSRCYDLSWSPDGLTWAYVDAPSEFAEVTQLWVISSSGGEPIPVTNGLTNDWNPSWSADGNMLFFVSNRGGGMDLWQQPMDENGKPEGQAEPVTTGLGIRSATFSPNGTKLAYSRGQRMSNVWRVPILQDRPATWADAEQLTFDAALIEFVHVSPDGKRLAVSSDRSGNQDLWIFPSEGGEMTQLTTDPTPDWNPQWSPDGKKIVFHAYRSGNRDIWVMPAEGGPARQLTSHPAQDLAPTWALDGQEIAFGSGRSGNRDIWVVDATGGEPRQVTNHPATDGGPAYSPDGEWLAFASSRTGSLRIFRLPVAGGEEPQRMCEGPGDRPRWSPDGKVLYFTRWIRGRPGNLWAVSLQDGREYPVTDLSARRGYIGADALATDGEFLYFVWREDQGDIWVTDVVYE